MLELQNFGHMNAFTKQSEHERNYDVKTFILRRSRVANFADIIKLVTMFKQPSKTQKQLKELESMY